jgi:hypothetical protein
MTPVGRGPGNRRYRGLFLLGLVLDPIQGSG